MYKNDEREEDMCLALREWAADERAEGRAEGAHYNVEMQGTDKGNLPKRSRFHQAEMDALELWPGEDFNELEPNYVIFICCFDPFGKGFVSTKGTNVNEVPSELVNFLRYVEDSTDECVEELGDNVVRFLHERVKRIKESREWERRYMRFEELLRDEYKEGHSEGLAEGLAQAENKMQTLIAKMVEAGETDKLSMLADREFLEEMYCKYGL